MELTFKAGDRILIGKEPAVVTHAGETLLHFVSDVTGWEGAVRYIHSGLKKVTTNDQQGQG